jgi:HAD superfamily hydrolase (TIGR01490 family)
MNIALFDFDGTITKKDSFYDFIGFVGKKHKSIGLKTFLFLPISILYAIGLIPMGKTKELFLTFCFKGWQKTYFDELAKRYADTILKQLIRPKALEQVKKHKSKGDRIVVVTASLDSWISSWCKEYGIDLISSNLEVKGGLLTGKLIREDCNGIEKVKRIQEKYNLNEYEAVYAYGDSVGDNEMLKMADIAFYKWKKLDR